MGIASNTALESMPAKLSDLPLACQIKKLKMSNNPHTPTTVLVASPKPLTSWKMPSAMQIPARMVSESRAGSTQSAIWPNVNTAWRHHEDRLHIGGECGSKDKINQQANDNFNQPHGNLRAGDDRSKLFWGYSLCRSSHYLPPQPLRKTCVSSTFGCFR